MKMELGIEIKLFSEWKLCLGWYNIASVGSSKGALAGSGLNVSHACHSTTNMYSDVV